MPSSCKTSASHPRSPARSPEARLHISTQMNTHNAAGIEAAARLGAQRVTLARELSVLEVAHLAEVADGYGMEV
ncbi:U32 family peptidase, partial [Eggerthella lenta]|uniref:U32 family peptidase n=1 Tax=Eggerthella lenta TaxID=84112 RepID=UPI0034E38CA3